MFGLDTFCLSNSLCWTMSLFLPSLHREHSNCVRNLFFYMLKFRFKIANDLAIICVLHYFYFVLKLKSIFKMDSLKFKKKLTIHLDWLFTFQTSSVASVHGFDIAGLCCPKLLYFLQHIYLIFYILHLFTFTRFFCHTKIWRLVKIEWNI